MWSLFKSLSAGFVALVVIAYIQLNRLQDFRSGQALTSDQNLAVETTRLNLKLLKVLPTLGFQNLIADWTFLKFLTYFGDEPARQKAGYGSSPDFFDIILTKDPYFLDGYLFLSASTTLYAGLPERTVQIIDQGLKSLGPEHPPQSYYVWRYKAIDELLFLGDSKAAQRSYQMAANWAEQEGTAESAYIAETSRQSADLLALNPASKKAQIDAWGMVFSQAFDDATRQLAQRRIEELGGSLVIQANGTALLRYPETEN